MDHTTTLRVAVGLAPLALPDSYIAFEGEVLSISAPGFLVNDLDFDGGTISASSINDSPDNGTVTAFTTGSFSYTPNPGFTGTDSFDYRITDGQGNFSIPAPVTITVLPNPNRAPIASNDDYVVAMNTVLSISAPGFLANDVDLDGDAISASSINDSPDNGTVTAFTTGSFSYTPNPGFTGTDSFDYRIADGQGNFSTPATVTIEVVTPAGPIPLALPDSYIAFEGEVLSISAPGFLVNDLDFDGGTISASSINDSPDNGTVTAFTTGSFSYTPNPGFTGTDSFDYRITDGQGNFSIPAPVTITVLPNPNRAPIASDDDYVVAMNTVLSISAPGFLANDVDLDGDAISASSINDSPDNGTVTAFTTGSFSYTPNPGFTGTDSFDYRIADGQGNFSTPATVTIYVLDPQNPVLPDPTPTDCFDPLTAPSYAGGYVLNAAQTRAFVRVDVPQGGTDFEFYNTSNLVVGLPEGDPESGVPLAGVTRTGDTFAFAPASPATVYFPITTAGSGTGVSFFLRVTDTCDRTVDVDPRFVLDALEGEVFAFNLEASTPNPVAGVATLRFTLAAAGPARITLYDALGREVAVAFDAPMEAGLHAVPFDASALPSGLYVLRLTAGAETTTRIMTVLR